MLTFSVKPDFDDYSSASWLIMKKAWFGRKMVVTMLALTASAWAVFLAADLFNGYPLDKVLWYNLLVATIIAAVGFVGALLVCLVSVPFSIRKTFEQLKTVDEATEFAIDESGFTTTTATAVSKHGWDHLIDYVQNGRVLLLRRTPIVIFIVPMRQLDEADRIALVAALGRAGVKQG